MHHRVFASLALFLATGCSYDICFDPSSLGTGSAGSVASTKSPIIGGSLDELNRSTVAILFTKTDGTNALCSGSVIAKNGSTGYVLTAAHCATGTIHHVYEATDWKDCTAAGDASKCRASYTPISWTRHPSYDPATLVDDFAVVVFEGATSDTTVVPAVSGADALTAAETVELSGYGRTYAGANDPSQFNTDRNHVSIPIQTVMTSWIRFDASQGKTACFGDSGGPAFATVGGARRIVGVASAGDANCEQVSIYGRVSSVYDDFIAPIIAPALAGDCNTCLQGSLVADAVCDFARLQCNANSDCSALLQCVEACAVPDQNCYVGCATPHPGGAASFNVLANCTACTSCSSECSVPACGTSASTTSSSTTGVTSSTSSGQGGASSEVTVTSASGAGGASQGGAGGAGQGGAGQGGASMGSAGDGGAASTSGGFVSSAGVGGEGGATGQGGSKSGWLGAGGGFSTSSSTSSTSGAGGSGASSSGSECVPVKIQCGISQPGRDVSENGLLALTALGLIGAGLARRRAQIEVVHIDGIRAPRGSLRSGSRHD